MRHRRPGWVRSSLAAGSLMLLGCTVDDPGASGVAGSSVAETPVDVSIVTDGLDRPTQLFVGNGEWLLAQLGGGEDERQGQVISIDPAQPNGRLVLVEGLNKPTGVARFAGSLWVMEADRLLRFEQDRFATPEAPLQPDDASVAAGPLPNNGRSEGTLSVIGERLVFDTSGARSGGVVVADSGRLWSIDAAGTVEELASGFKHAYAHTVLPDGSLLVTEISDGRFDGDPAADALARVMEGTDHGWPMCVPDQGSLERRAVQAFGATAERCASLPPLLAVFDVGATPTSVAMVPWDSDSVAVALWNQALVVTVALDTGAVTPLALQRQLAADDGGSPRPQHLVVDGNRLLVVDHDEGRIYALTS